MDRPPAGVPALAAGRLLRQGACDDVDRLNRLSEGKCGRAAFSRRPHAFADSRFSFGSNGQSAVHPAELWMGVADRFADSGTGEGFSRCSVFH
jgi:hypothetical protein